MGQRDGFSDSDVAKLNAMYECKKNSGSSIGTTRRPSAGRPPAVLSSGSPSTSNSGNSYPVLNFINNLVKPFFQEEIDSNETVETNESNSTEVI